jgi:NAD(P)-dependent dehydrogenase (short-subunit alcohol dehydrogenase family)
MGRLDIMVNNAGIVEVSPFLEVTEDHWDRIFAVNTKGTLFGIQAAARVMIDFAIEGRIVNIASVAGKGGRPLLAAYAASKAAVINLTQSAAYALAQYRITVNSICPGVVGTDMGRKALSEMSAITTGTGIPGEQSRVPAAPLGPEASPADVAGMVAYLVSTEAAYITAQAFNVDGGRCTH